MREDYRGMCALRSAMRDTITLPPRHIFRDTCRAERHIVVTLLLLLLRCYDAAHALSADVMIRFHGCAAAIMMLFS